MTLWGFDIVQVLARSSPEDKLTLVSLLKHHGEVVAVTGESTHLTPLLSLLVAPSLPLFCFFPLVGRMGHELCSQLIELRVIVPHVD